MTFLSNRAALVCIACFGLAACDAPQLVSLQPIGAPQPTDAKQTFVDADGCSWWIIGNGDELRWAPQTNASGEHVCNGGQVQIEEAEEDTVTAVIPPDTTFINETRAAIDDTPTPSAPADDNRSSFVQVATFAKESNAIASENLFRSLGYRISSGSETRDNDRLYRLILGPFQSREDAQDAVDRAFAEGFDDAFPFRR